MLRATQILRLVLPHGAIQALRLYRELVRLGVPPRRAASLTPHPSSAEALAYTRLGLLPDGALAQPRAMIDIGANRGFWTARARTIADPEVILAIEPDPHVLDELRRRIEPFGERVRLAPVALGAHRSTERLFSASESSGSSLLKPRVLEMNEIYGKGLETIDRPEVTVAPLDEVAEELPEITVIKIDVQGYESAVLAGAARTLQRTRFVIMEVNFYSHYEDDVLFSGIHSQMGAFGFSLWNMTEPCKVGGKAMWADAVYIRG